MSIRPVTGLLVSLLLLTGCTSQEERTAACTEYVDAYQAWNDAAPRDAYGGSDLTWEEEKALDVPYWEAEETLLDVVDIEDVAQTETRYERARRIVAKCRNNGVDVSIVAAPSTVREGAVDRSDRTTEGATDSSRTPSGGGSSSGSGPSPSGGSSGTAPEAQQRQALQIMWSEMSPSSQESTCEVYRQSPDSLIDGFMQEAAGLMDRQVVRGFYNGKCG